MHSSYLIGNSVSIVTTNGLMLREIIVVCEKHTEHTYCVRRIQSSLMLEQVVRIVTNVLYWVDMPGFK
jgi:hypothetical protein